MTFTRSLVIFSVCLIVCVLTGKLRPFIFNFLNRNANNLSYLSNFIKYSIDSQVQAASSAEDDLTESEWNEDEERFAIEVGAYLLDGAAEEEERQARNQGKSIDELWKEANPISWTMNKKV